ncbi:MAG TPA: OmpH family outer membrane protein [Rhizomicrobium sp.]|jgi:outer membrane protein|nr:OmpH family outer membrane protein [Rhizomicrobium sp.]
MNKMSNLGRAAIYAALSTFVAVVAVQAAPAPAPQQPAKPAANAAAPMPRILVIDRTAILRDSNVGKDIVQQVTALTQQAERQLKGQSDALRKEGQALQQQVAILSASVRDQKVKAFQAKQAGFQQTVQQRQLQIQGGVMQARQQVEKALGPILNGIMTERGANLLLDRQAIVLGTVNIDITATAIQRLNQKLPKVKVQLVNPPPGTVPAGQ